jgi:hypothetical protein
MTPLPLRETSTPRPLTPAATLLRNASILATKTCRQSPLDTVTEYLIGKNNMATVYMSPDTYFEAFEEMIDLCKFDLEKHHTAGLCLAQNDRRLILGGIAPSTPGARIPRWHSRIKGAWLIKVGDTQVSTIADVKKAFAEAFETGLPSLTLLFSHPEVRQDVSHDGLPIVSSAPFSQHVHDQLNKC